MRLLILYTICYLNLDHKSGVERGKTIFPKVDQSFSKIWYVWTYFYEILV